MKRRLLHFLTLAALLTPSLRAQLVIPDGPNDNGNVLPGAPTTWSSPAIINMQSLDAAFGKGGPPVFSLNTKSLPYAPPSFQNPLGRVVTKSPVPNGLYVTLANPFTQNTGTPSVRVFATTATTGSLLSSNMTAVFTNGQQQSIIPPLDVGFGTVVQIPWFPPADIPAGNLYTLLATVAPAPASPNTATTPRAIETAARTTILVDNNCFLNGGQMPRGVPPNGGVSPEGDNPQRYRFRVANNSSGPRVSRLLFREQSEEELLALQFHSGPPGEDAGLGGEPRVARTPGDSLFDLGRIRLFFPEALALKLNAVFVPVPGMDFFLEADPDNAALQRGVLLLTAHDASIAGFTLDAGETHVVTFEFQRLSNTHPEGRIFNWEIGQSAAYPTGGAEANDLPDMSDLARAALYGPPVLDTALNDERLTGGITFVLDMNLSPLVRAHADWIFTTEPQPLAAWLAPAFNPLPDTPGSQWHTGYAGFGSPGTADIQTVLTPPPVVFPSWLKLIRHFNVPADYLLPGVKARGLWLGLRLDGAAEVFINGEAIAPITAAFVSGIDENTWTWRQLPAAALNLLHPGDNVIAFSLRQDDTHNDFAFDAQLYLNPPLEGTLAANHTPFVEFLPAEFTPVTPGEFDTPSPQTITVTADVRDTDLASSITRVRFLLDGVLLANGEDLTAPYQVTFTTPVGSYLLSAVAYDEFGQRGRAYARTGAGTPPVVIAEIFPSPGPEEFIELLNPGSAPVNLGLWQIEGLINFAIPPGIVLAPGARLVIAQQPALIPGSLGPFAGDLSPGGTITLRDAAGVLMARVTFRQDGGAWPAVPGQALVLLSPELALAADNPLHWRNALASPGAAGDALAPPAPGPGGDWGDADQDGLNDLLEAVLPGPAPGDAGLVVVPGGAMAFERNPRIAAMVRPEFANDLRQWTPVNPNGIVRQVLPNGNERLQFQLPPAPQQFIRVVVAPLAVP